MLKTQIAENLERAFSQLGFAEINVAQLKSSSGVSLRTLYRYYPSKEEMVVAALNNRHKRYLNFLSEDLPSPGEEAIVHIFNKLNMWMNENAPNGCMSISALNAFPENSTIKEAVEKHKKDVEYFLGKKSDRDALSTQLFLLHEGVTSAQPLIGDDALTSAQAIIKQLFGDD